MRERGEANTPADVLAKYGDGDWPLRAAYNLGEVASNGNYLEDPEISVRHGICGDPEQVPRTARQTHASKGVHLDVLKALYSPPKA